MVKDTESFLTGPDGPEAFVPLPPDWVCEIDPNDHVGSKDGLVEDGEPHLLRRVCRWVVRRWT